MCDSTSDLGLDFLNENDIHLFPLQIHLKEEEYQDVLELQPDKIYQSIAQGVHPKSSQVPVAEYLKMFYEMAKEKESGIYIAISSKLSGTYDTALVAYKAILEEYPDFDLRIIDSKTASLGTGVQVVNALKMKNEGKSLDEIEDRIRFIADHLVTLLTVSDLNYLAEGGRISKSQAAIGSMLQINPIIEVVDGEVKIIEKVRGKKRLLKRLMEIVETRADQIEKQTVGIVYSNEEDMKIKLIEAMESRFKYEELVVRPVGATIATHTGLGTMGVTFLEQYE